MKTERVSSVRAAFRRVVRKDEHLRRALVEYVETRRAWLAGEGSEGAPDMDLAALSVARALSLAVDAFEGESNDPAKWLVEPQRAKRKPAAGECFGHPPGPFDPPATVYCDGSCAHPAKTAKASGSVAARRRRLRRGKA